MPGTITVACKLPHGLVLQLCRPRPTHVSEAQVIQHAVEGEKAKPRTPWEKYGKTVTIKGYAIKSDGPDDSPKAVRTSTFALTHGVDADFFEEWMKQNAESAMVKGGFVYGAAKTPDLEAHAKLYRDEKCGLEPTDPKNLPHEFKNKIETASAA